MFCSSTHGYCLELAHNKSSDFLQISTYFNLLPLLYNNNVRWKSDIQFIRHPIKKGDSILASGQLFENYQILMILTLSFSSFNNFHHKKTALRMLKNLIKCYLDMDVFHISSTLYRLQEMSNHSLRFVVTAGCRIEIAPLPPRHNSLNILTKLTTASIHRELKNVKNVHWKNTCLNNNHQHIKNVDVKIKLSIHQKCYRKCVETSTVNVNIRLC